MYRIRLGKQIVGGNKVTNGDFSTRDLTGWEEAYGWYENEGTIDGALQYVLFGGTTPAVENPESRSSSISYLLMQRAILERGKEYRISFEILELTDNAELAVKIGDWGKHSYNEIGEYSVDRLVLDRGDLVFHPLGEQVFTNISAYELRWNDPLNDEPVNMLDINSSIVQDENIEGLFLEFIDDLEFVGDGYEFLAQKRDELGFDGVVPILIEESEDGYFWERRFEGTINISDIIFDESRKVARAEVNDTSVPAMIANNTDTSVNLRPAYIDGGVGVPKSFYNYGQPFHLQDRFDPSSGTYNESITYRIENAFQYIVNFITDSRAIVMSDAFSDPSIYGDHLLSMIYDTLDVQDFYLSFSDLFEIVNTVYNVTVQFTTVEGVPMVIISRKSDVQTSEIYLQFENARISRRQFQDAIPKNVKSGYQQPDEGWDLFKLSADKVNAQGYEKILQPPIVYVEDAGTYDSSDMANGDILLVESEPNSDPYVFNNGGNPGGAGGLPEIINYYRPFYRHYANKSTINETIKDFTFPVSNWMVSLPFNLIGANRGEIQVFSKSNDAFIEEIEFEAPISKEDWNNLAYQKIGKQNVVDPCFTSNNTWDTNGNWSVIGNGVATLNSYSNGAYIRNFFRDNLVPGKKYRVKIRMQGWSENTDTSWSVAFIDASGSPIANIGNITPNFYLGSGYATYDHIYDFFYTVPGGTNTLAGIGLFISSVGGGPTAETTFLQVDVFESKILKNVNKMIKVNGYPCRILEIERDNKTGSSQITALKKYENAD